MLPLSRVKPLEADDPDFRRRRRKRPSGRKVGDTHSGSYLVLGHPGGFALGFLISEWGEQGYWP